MTNQMSYYSTIGSCDQDFLLYKQMKVIDNDQSVFLLQSHDGNVTQSDVSYNHKGHVIINQSDSCYTANQMCYYNHMRVM